MNVICYKLGHATIAYSKLTVLQNLVPKQQLNITTQLKSTPLLICGYILNIYLSSPVITMLKIPKVIYVHLLFIVVKIYSS